MKRIKESNGMNGLNNDHNADLSLSIGGEHASSDRLFMSPSKGWFKTKRAWLIIALLLLSEIIFHVVRTAIMINAHYFSGCSLMPLTWQNGDWLVPLSHGILELIFICGVLSFYHSGENFIALAFAILLLVFCPLRYPGLRESNKVFYLPFVFWSDWLMLMIWLLQIGLYPLLLLLLVSINKEKADTVISIIATGFTILNIIMAFRILGIDSSLMRLVNLTARLLYLIAMFYVFAGDRMLVNWRRSAQT